MHELSIAQNVVEIVCQNVPKQDLPDVRKVRLRVGAFSGVVAQSLEFSYSAITAGTPLGGSGLDIEEVPFTIHCRACGQLTTNDAGVAVCSKCGSPDTELVAGTELHVVEIELADHPSEIS